MKTTGDGPFGQCGVSPSHDGTVRRQSHVPGGLIGSAGVEPSGTIFREYVAGSDPTFKMSELARDSTLTVHIRIVHDWRFRLGLWLVRIGARLAGFAVRTIELTSDDAQ